MRSVVESDYEIENSLKTLVKPMGNCCTALKRMKDTLSPYIKAEASWVQISGQDPDSGNSQPVSVE